MNVTEQNQSPTPNLQPPSPRAAALEGIAFTFCKAATIMLITWPLRRYALPLVAGVTAVLFIAALVSGQRESRCVLRKPLWIAAFWASICAASLFAAMRLP